MVFLENDDSMVEITRPVVRNGTDKDLDTDGVPDEPIDKIETTKPGKRSYRNIDEQDIKDAIPQAAMGPRPSELSVESLARLTEDRAVDVFINTLEREK